MTKETTRRITRFTKFILAAAFLGFIPLTALAQGAARSANATDVITRISNLFSAILPVLVSLGVIYFVWGVVIYFIGDSEEAKEKGRDRIIYGIIGLAVIVSLWGIVTIVTDTFGIGSTGALTDEINNLGVKPADSSSCFDNNKIRNNPKLADLLNYATCVIGNSVIPLIFALATVMFIWGAVRFFLIDADDQEKRTQGKQFMLWGIIALAVMISIWGLVRIVGSTFGVDTTFLPEVKKQQ